MYKKVEFFGLPGTGKTYLANNLIELLEKEGFIYSNATNHITVKNRAYRAIYKFMLVCKEVVCRPNAFIGEASLIIKTKQRNVIDLLKVLTNWFYIISILKKSNKENLVFDQGVCQALWAIFLGSSTLENTDQIIKRLMKLSYIPDMVVVVKSDKEIIKDRYIKRGTIKGRIENSQLMDDQKMWDNADWIFSQIEKMLKDNNVKVIHLENNSHEQLENNIHLIKKDIKLAKKFSIS